MAANRIYHPLIVEYGKGGAARDRAIAKIRAALKTNHGRIVETAQALGCAPRTLRMWLAREPERLQAYAAGLRERAGVPGPREARN